MSPRPEPESGDGILRAAPVLGMALFGVSWSAVLVRLAAAPAASVAFWRLLLSVLVLVPLFAHRRSWRDYRGLSVRTWGWVAGAAVALALHFILWFVSLEYTSVASSTVLVSAHPLFVGLLSARWLREPPGTGEWTGMLVAVGGAVLIGWGDFSAGPTPLLGDALALLAALCGAAYFVAGRRLRPRLGIWSYVGPVYALAGGLTAIYMLVRGHPFGGWGGGTWAALAGLAAGPMLLGHTGFNWALKHVRAYVVSLVMLLEPVGATLLAVWVLGSKEIPGAHTFLGGALTLVGVGLSLRARARSREDETEPAEATAGGESAANRGGRD